MKSAEAIAKRLKNLRFRYAKQYIKNSQDRCHRNCVHNHEQAPLKPLQYSRTPVEHERAPRQSVTLIMIEDPKPLRLCMYGSHNPATWEGDICDNDAKARDCKWFDPKVKLQEAEEKFNELMSDDAYVLEHYPDIAALQWVLDTRVHSKPLSLLEQFKLRWLRWRNPVLYKLPAASDSQDDPS